jgi:hypothetical protein
MAATGRRIRIARAAIILGLLVASGGLLAGCVNFFRPGEPQPPPGSSGARIPLQYTSPAATLNTIKAAISAKGSGNARAAYIGAFANTTTDGVSFSATFDPVVVERRRASGRTVPTWTLELEENFYSRFVLLRSAAYDLRWSEHPTAGSDEVGDDDATLHRRYEVFLADEAGSTLGRIAVGLVDLTFRKVDGRWAIVLWEDRLDAAADPNDPDEISLGERRLETQ